MQGTWSDGSAVTVTFVEAMEQKTQMFFYYFSFVIFLSCLEQEIRQKCNR